MSNFDDPYARPFSRDQRIRPVGNIRQIPVEQSEPIQSARTDRVYNERLINGNIGRTDGMSTFAYDNFIKQRDYHIARRDKSYKEDRAKMVNQALSDLDKEIQEKHNNAVEWLEL